MHHSSWIWSKRAYNSMKWGYLKAIIGALGFTGKWIELMDHDVHHHGALQHSSKRGVNGAICLIPWFYAVRRPVALSLLSLHHLRGGFVAATLES